LIGFRSRNTFSTNTPAINFHRLKSVLVSIFDDCWPSTQQVGRYTLAESWGDHYPFDLTIQVSRSSIPCQLDLSIFATMKAASTAENESPPQATVTVRT